jgi:DNA polymerase-3 subunit gamma/tau
MKYLQKDLTVSFCIRTSIPFRDLLVSKTPSTLTTGSWEQAQKMFTGSKCTQDFLLKGITIANDCDLKFKLSQNQRLLVELCLMQLASITFDGEKKLTHL